MKVSIPHQNPIGWSLLLFPGEQGRVGWWKFSNSDCKISVALAGVAQLVGTSSSNQNIGGLIPSQGTYQVVGSIPSLV